MTQKELSLLIKGIISILIILLVVLFVLLFAVLRNIQHNATTLNMNREWKMQIIDDNDVRLISKPDTILLSFENTYGLQSINDIVFTNK